MKFRHWMILAAGSCVLTACAHEDRVNAASAPPPGPGAIPGTMVADRDGDGTPDGWYTPDGTYHAFQAAPCPPPPPPPSRRGERG
jgi:hypothetical protein